MATLEEARDHVREALETRDVLGNLRCPTSVLHGGTDEIPMTFVDTLRAFAVNAPLTVVVEPGSALTKAFRTSMEIDGSWCGEWITVLASSAGP